MGAISHFIEIEQEALEQLYECSVISRDGVRLGTIIDLIRRDGKIIALEVSGAGMFGVGSGHFRLPISSLVRIDGLNVHVTRESRQLC